ncbi:MAG: hypothetical protein QNM02_14820 [Acidimicrobiia bacterium]|nr:hypothetical protein [Acidimicrobiia bacterium]
MGREGSREVLAEYDKWLRLVRVSDAGRGQHFVVDVLDGGGDVLESACYAHDDFALAANDYNLRVLRVPGSPTTPAAEIALDAVSSMSRSDHGSFAASLDDDFVQVDHRPIGYPDLDKAGLQHTLAAHTGLENVWLTEKPHAGSSTARLVTGGFWMVNFGQWSQFEYGIYLSVMAGSRIARLEIFPEDQLDAALARLDELTSSPQADA